MKIALLGFGVVGRGVYDICQTLPGLEIVHILRRKGSPRELPIITDCFEDIVSDPSVDCVVEAMGCTRRASICWPALRRASRS